MAAEDADRRAPDPWLPLAVALVIVLGWAVWADLAPAGPQADGAAPSGFSAERTLAVLERLLGDGAPRPMGSGAHAATRARLLAELEALGYEPEVQEAVGCWRRGICGTVRNVVARRPGRESGAAVLVASHYDTQPHTPGAADAGAGVASLVEIARVLSTRPAGRNAVMLLATDGEERGMLGAAAFLQQHAAAGTVRAVVNLEARGTTGPSVLVATGPGSGGIVERLGTDCDGVVASSFVVGVASRLPAFSDFFLFAERGLAGVELSFVDGRARHHTPLDDLAHLDPASVQQQGACALALVASLAEGELPGGGGDRVFFSLPGLGLLGWPPGWTPALALLGALLVAAATAQLLARGRVSARSLAWGLAMGPLALGTAIALRAGLGKLLRLTSGVAGPLGGVEFPWTAHPLPAALAFWAVSVLGSAYVAVWLAGRAGFFGLWCGVWIGCALLALLAGFYAPALGAPVLVPTLVAGVAFWVLGAGSARSASWRAPLAALLGLGAGAALFLQLALLVQRLSGTPEFAPLVAFVVAMASPHLALATSRARLVVLAGAAFVGVAATVASVASPSFDEEHPREISLEYVQGADAEARWVVNVPSGVLPASLASLLEAEPDSGSAGLQAFEVRLRGDMTLARTLSARAPSVPVDPPELAGRGNFYRDGLRHVRLRLRSPRGAPHVELCLDSLNEVVEAAFEGEPLPPRLGPAPVRSGGFDQCFAYANVPPRGVDLSLALVVAGETEGLLRDVSPELPDVARPLEAARPPSAVPRHGGDRWVVERKVRF